MDPLTQPGPTDLRLRHPPVAGIRATGPAMHSPHVVRAVQPVERRSRDRRACLVVEDDPVSREIVLSQLRTLGLDATGAGSCGECMAQIGQRPLSVVLIDCGLPDGDGYGLARRIRRRERRPRWTPACSAAVSPLLLIALSASGGDEHLRRCLSAGIDRVTTKPVSLPRLAALLGMRLDHFSGAEALCAGGGVRTGGRLAPVLPQALRELYRSSCLHDLAALKQAMEDRRWRQAREHAHRIRGASQVVGAHAVAGIASVLERMDGGRPADDRAQARAVRWLDRILAPSVRAIPGWPA